MLFPTRDHEHLNADTEASAVYVNGNTHFPSIGVLHVWSLHQKVKDLKIPTGPCCFRSTWSLVALLSF